jgi:hypothetical protein
LRKDFAAEPVDPTWAASTESEMLKKLDARSYDKQIDILNREIECRSNTCRVLITYAAQGNEAADRRALIKICGPVSDVIREITQGSPSVTGALALHRGGFVGEPVTSEIFLTRKGFKQVMDFWVNSNTVATK